MYKNINIWILLLLVFSSCGIINIRKGSSEADLYSNYSEDLSDKRVHFEELPSPDEFEGNSNVTLPIDQDLDKTMLSIIAENKKDMFFNGFTILIYSGVDREMAFETRNEIYSEFPDIQTNMEYQQPRYLVKIGKYINRIEALTEYEKLKENFPSARIVPDKFLKGKDQRKEEEENFDNAAR